MVNSVSPDRAHVQFDPRAKLSLTLSATTYQPCNDRKCETTKLSRSFQSNKRLSNFHWHPPISMALAIKAQLSQQKSLWRTSSFALEHSRRCSIESPRRKKAFFCSCKLYRADASKTFVSPRFRKQLFVLWEPREFGECGDRSAFGDVCDTCNEDPV